MCCAPKLPAAYLEVPCRTCYSRQIFRINPSPSLRTNWLTPFPIRRHTIYPVLTAELVFQCPLCPDLTEPDAKFSGFFFRVLTCWCCGKCLIPLTSGEETCLGCGYPVDETWKTCWITPSNMEMRARTMIREEDGPGLPMWFEIRQKEDAIILYLTDIDERLTEVGRRNRKNADRRREVRVAVEVEKERSRWYNFVVGARRSLRGWIRFRVKRLRDRTRTGSAMNGNEWMAS